MTQKLILSIVTPEKQLVSEEVDQVNVPGTEGDLGILHDHAPILTLLRTGQLSYEKEGETIFMVVSGGYLERAERARTEAEKRLGETDISEEEYIETQKKLFRAIARLENSENN